MTHQLTPQLYGPPRRYESACQYWSATGNEELAEEGALDQATGAVQGTAGRAAHAVVDTIHELNR
jgi:hypothetical protein